MDAVKLIQYNHAARREYLEALKKLPWKVVVEDRGASFPSIRDIFLHALDVEDRLINYVIAGRSEEWASVGYEKFGDVESIERRVDGVEKKVEAYLGKLTPHELERKVLLPWRREPPLVMRVEDVLIHTCIEDISHLGELIAIFWQMEQNPPFLSWSRFLRL